MYISSNSMELNIKNAGKLASSLQLYDGAQCKKCCEIALIYWHPDMKHSTQTHSSFMMEFNVKKFEKLASRYKTFTRAHSSYMMEFNVKIVEKLASRYRTLHTSSPQLYDGVQRKNC